MRWLMILVLLVSATAAAEGIPLAASRYRLDLTRQARQVWGINAPVATFAAQVQQESRWRADAVSPVGARGLAQFMPATAAWMETLDPDLNTTQPASRGEPVSGSPWGPANPVWALRALVTYDKFLYDRAAGLTDCDRMWFALWGYNGGETWRRRDQALAARHGANVRLALEVEPYNAGRSRAAFAENRAYPRLILQRWEPVYESAGWGSGVCPHARKAGSLPPKGADAGLGRPCASVGVCP